MRWTRPLKKTVEGYGDGHYARPGISNFPGTARQKLIEAGRGYSTCLRPSQEDVTTFLANSNYSAVVFSENVKRKISSAAPKPPDRLYFLYCQRIVPTAVDYLLGSGRSSCPLTRQQEASTLGAP